MRAEPFTEADWSDETNRSDTSPYDRAKTIAERAAWAWLAAEGGGLELVTVNPGLVLGPVRAVFGVAETGSVLLTDETLKVNALAYLAQHLVVLLDPSDIVANLHNVYARSEMGKFSYAVLHSGPSATADIEGVLILGAQGVRSLSIILAPRPARAR